MTIEPTKTRSQVAAEYGISLRTLKRKLLKLGIYLPNGLLYPEALKSIYSALSEPEKKIVP